MSVLRDPSVPYCIDPSEGTRKEFLDADASHVVVNISEMRCT